MSRERVSRGAAGIVERRRQRLDPPEVASIADAALVEAIGNAERGLIDADLGGGLIKLRIARPGAGKRGGYRMLIGFRAGDRAVFIFGFAKKDMDNISDGQLAIVRQLGQDIMRAKDAEIAQQVETGKLQKIKHA